METAMSDHKITALGDDPFLGLDRRSVLLAGAAYAAAAASGAIGTSDVAQAQQQSAVSSSTRPNVVLILADDLGNADLGYRGSDIKTPNIDALAAGGVRCESYYGLPLCTPARAALMTGRYPMRHGLQTLVIFPSHTYGLPTDERTLPQALKDVGYNTAIVGKWHLGHASAKYWPQSRGFDHFYGNVTGEVDYFTHERGGVIDWQRNGEFLKEGGYYTTLIGDEAVKLIDQQTAAKPFFLYFASMAPHAPYEAPREAMEPYASIKDEKRRAYAAMITLLDDQVGRMVRALEAKGLRENTLIIFTTDNGGATSALFASGARSPEERVASGGVALGDKPPASNGQFRDGKGTLHEGGVRLPAIFNWPARLKPRVVNEPLHHVDIMPTLLVLAGASASKDHPLDGKDVWATLANGAPSPNDEILINVEPVRGAIRKGQWKLVKWAPMPSRTELYDIVADPAERDNLVEKHPDIARDLEARLLVYARQMKTPEWIKAQPQFLGAQGHTVLDPEFDVSDGGLPHEKPLLPGGFGRALQ
jgi:arylsulfatase A-like enzyme